MAEILGPMKRFDPKVLDQFKPAKPPRFNPERVKSQFFHVKNQRQETAMLIGVGTGISVLALAVAAPLLLEDTYRFLVNNPAMQQAAVRAGEILHVVVK